MKYSQLFGKTNKIMPKNEMAVNAQLLIRAGFVHKEMAGVYSFLPLGLRVLKKIEQIIREEMDKIGQEMLMPGLAQKKTWEDTGRIKTVDVLFKAVGANEASRKKNDAEYILNCTQEDVITPIAKQFFTSYKDFPFALYHIQVKYRNEPRVKSGLLRGREFRMKDLYSFHTSEESLLDYYEAIAKPAYVKTFERLGLGDSTVIALASGGDFTEKYSHEFQTMCETGEDTLFYDEKNNIYYNREVAPVKAPKVTYKDNEMFPREDVEGKGIIGVDELALYLKIPVEKTTKTLLFETDGGGVIAAAVRGGYDIDEGKLKKIVKCKSLLLAGEETVRKVTGAEVGYAGLLNLSDNVKIYMDESMKGRLNFEMGGNKTNFHSVNVNFGRDFDEPDQFYDFKVAKEGDLNPETNEPYKTFTTSEVGNIFPLNTKFSDAIGYTYTDENGKQKPVFMGSYGIGTTRVLGVLVEKYHDEKGMIWPKQVAPFDAHLIDLRLQTVDGRKKAEEFYNQLQKQRVEVLWDDREDVSAGQKFADADLIGIPVRLVISEKTGDKVEWKERGKKETRSLSVEEMVRKLR